MASVGIEKVVKTYGNHTVLHGVDVTVPDGAFVILVGPSGCGKSTLLRSIAGLESISGGRITIDGTDVSKAPPKDRDIAMVFQNYALYPHMTVAQNMGFSLKLAGAPREESEQRVRKAAEILGLGDLLHRYPKQLSGGQRQRVAMGRAIVRNPKVFLFDEPLSNLDAKLRVQMRLEIKELHQTLGTTIIYVTHDQVEAMTMADVIVVMRDGRIEQIGTPLELYDTPANTFVAGFIGSPAMNLVRGRVDDSGQRLVTDAGTSLPLPRRIEPGRDILLGVRPEHLHLDPEGAPLEVVTVEPMGSETQLHLRRGTDDLVLSTRDRVPASRGASVTVGYAPGDCHLFDGATGSRL